jgi:hypothetical protein
VKIELLAFEEGSLEAGGREQEQWRVGHDSTS